MNEMLEVVKQAKDEILNLQEINKELEDIIVELWRLGSWPTKELADRMAAVVVRRAEKQSSAS